MIKQRIYNFALFNTPKIHSIHNTYSARAFFSPQGSWLASTRSKILIQRATRRFIHVLFSSMSLCKRVHLRSDSHGPLTLQARLLAHFQTQLTACCCQSASKWRLLFGNWEWNYVEWNRDRVTAECEIVNRVNVVRYKIGMLRETGSFGTCSCSQNRRWGYAASASSHHTLPYHSSSSGSVEIIMEKVG